ncbi:hypothetical protein N5T80_03655 [Aliarcobacter cryaerophilus]|uniref:hypothetical protein n=1 Tax=Aliarcobacter cryaerophilus TaxID=28198 RepID=UPI0021B5B8CA|nr:hypothetical protein [Aliarcobacter cryaerophilus]MCT7545410.1 hypothetical protein [Aliarcobacter cryaerophilus]
MEEIKLPKRSDLIYKEIEEFEDYEYSNCIAYEMCIRNKEVKKLLNIIINKFDEIFEATEFEFIINEEAIEKECNELKKYGIGFNTVSSILTDIFYEINDIEVGKSGISIEYENDLILDRKKDYVYVHLIDDGIVGVLENGDEEIIPYKQMNLDYIPLIKKSYSRPTLKIDKSKIFKVELNLSLPKEELLDYVSKIKDDFNNKTDAMIRTPIDLLIYDSSLMEYIGKENNTSEINRKLDSLEDILFDDKTDNSNIKKLKKKLIADKFFIYDYLKARQEQIKQMNNQIIEEYEDKIQNIKNDSEDNKTSRINYLKKELSQDRINTTDTQILEELKEIENIPYGTARRYYDDIRPFIDNCEYKELITGTIN